MEGAFACDSGAGEEGGRSEKWTEMKKSEGDEQIKIRPMEKEKPARGYLAGFKKDPAASYSPTGLPQQYHRLRGA